MIIHNPILTGSLSLNGTNLSTTNLVTTGSNTFVGNQVVSGSLTTSGSITTTGTLTAQTLVVQTITSSVDFVTGSTRFGSLSSNTHIFTGSMSVTGALNATGTITAGAANGNIRLSGTTDGFIGVNTSTMYLTDWATAAKGMVINLSTGNVGIGTSSPARTLSVVGSIGFYNNTGANDSHLLQYNDGSLSVIASTYGSTGTYNPLVFKTADAEVMRITTAGIVGIGTNSPAIGRKLTVAGGAQFTYGDNSGASFNIIPASTGQGGTDFNLSYHTGTGYGPLTFTLSGAEKMRITADGNVLIGTTSDAYGNLLALVQSNSSSATTLQITNSSNASSTTKTAQVMFNISDTGNTIKNAANVVAVPSGVNVLTADLTFGTRGGDSNPPAERMRISSNTYGTLVAIGTSTPTNGGSAASWLTLDGSTAGTYSGGIAFSYNSAAKAYQFWDNNNFYIQNGANGVYLARDASSWSSVSDERLKDITGNIDNAVSSLLTLSTVKHTYKSDSDKKEHLGLIAQEIQEVFPQVIDKTTIREDETKTEYLGVRYTELIPVLVKAIQELKAEIDELKNK